jgi:uncharacterized protein YcfJ
MKKLLSHIIACSVLTAALTSCSSLNTNQGQVTAISSGIGAGVGAALGQVVGRNTKSTLIGAGIGAVVGGVTGDYVGRDTESSRYQPQEQRYQEYNNPYNNRQQNYYDDDYSWRKR